MVLFIFRIPVSTWLVSSLSGRLFCTLMHACSSLAVRLKRHGLPFRFVLS